MYEKNIISYLQLLQSKIKIDRMAITLNQNKLDQFMTIVALYQDLAGGYSVASEQARESQ